MVLVGQKCQWGQFMAKESHGEAKKGQSGAYLCSKINIFKKYILPQSSFQFVKFFKGHWNQTLNFPMGLLFFYPKLILALLMCLYRVIHLKKNKSNEL